MNKVVTVNLNGRAFQVEEQSFEALRAYLDEAARLLTDDPDCKEIMADLEQAIADKAARFLGSSKNVITQSEMDRILKEMGPVEPGADVAAGTSGNAGTGPSGDANARATATPQRDPNTPRRLYQINEGAWLAGVCNGIGAYFGVDPMVVRLIFVLLLFLSGGFWIIAYLVLMFVLPTAKTPEERAAARGLPFNAQELVDQAKRHYSDLKDGHDRWRDKRRRERERKFWQAKEQHGYEPPRPFDVPQSGYGARVAAGIVLPLIGIVSAVLTVVWIIAMLSLLTTGEILGWHLPLDVPPWTAILVLVAAYAVVAVPLRAIRYASFESLGRHRGWFVFWDGVLWFALVILAWWVAANYIPGVREFFHDLFHHTDWRDIPVEIGRSLSGLSRIFG